MYSRARFDAAIRFEFPALITLLPLALAPVAARAVEALVVLSDPAAPAYREALEGLRSEWPGTLAAASADRPLPPGPYGVVIALGGKAARRASEGRAPTVVALAPGYRGGTGFPAVRVEMTPSPERVAAAMAAAGVRRLLAVRASPASAEFARRAAAAGESAGVSIEEVLLPSPERFPALLRRHGTRADALWLEPDPAVVTPEIFAAAREFSRARSIPFFAPAAGLVDGEVRGELAVSFGDCGREAARAAGDLLAGRPVPRRVYPREALARDRPRGR